MKGVATTLTAVVLLGGGIGIGWYAAETVVSPAQRAAAASPPQSEDVVVAVQQGALAETLTARAVVGEAQQTTVRLSLGDGSSVVTSNPVGAGQAIISGQPALEVSGRPVFALSGSFPFYRDLREGDTGPDVEQLQRGLKSAGFSVGVDGDFGARTAAAVVAMFERAGYDQSLVVGEEAVDDADASVGAPGQAESAPADGEQDLAPPASLGATSTETTREFVSITVADLVVAPSLPLLLSAAPTVGTVLSSDNATIVLSDGSLSVSSNIPPATALQVPQGSPVTLTGAGLSISARTGAPTGDASAAEMILPYVVEQGSLPPEARGTEMLATITAQVVADDALIVPTRSVSTHSTGATVLKRDSDGSTTETRVELLGTLAGQSAIRPIEAGTLDVGDEVVVR